MTRKVPGGPLLAIGGVLLLTAGFIGLARREARAAASQHPHHNTPERGNADKLVEVVVARRLNRAAGTLALSVLVDSALEHYRGSFKNKAMFIPLVVSALTLAVSVHGHSDKNHGAHVGRNTIYGLALVTGCVGTAFHVYNVGKKVGGFSWQNLFYGAPLGAPMAVLLSGLIGYCSERVRESGPGTSPMIFHRPAGPAMALITSVGLLGTTGEVGLMHFRGAFHNPIMAIPVILPPIGALLLVLAARNPRRDLWFTRFWLRLLATMGFAGVGFHAYGVSRNMGGWRNWSQNLLNGPPIPAPPSFTGLALAGLAALHLMEECSDA